MSDKPRSGSPVEVSGRALESRTDGHIRDNRILSVELVVEEVQISVVSVLNSIPNQQSTE